MLAGEIVACARRQETLDTALKLKLCDSVTTDPAVAAQSADLVVLGTPLSAYGEIAKAIGPALKPGAVVTDVGSVKQAVIRDVLPHIPRRRAFRARPSRRAPSIQVPPRASPISSTTAGAS